MRIKIKIKTLFLMVLGKVIKAALKVATGLSVEKDLEEKDPVPLAPKDREEKVAKNFG